MHFTSACKRRAPWPWLVTLALALPAMASAQVHDVAAVRMTVADLDTALDFYTRVLPFELVSQTRVDGADYGRLFGKRRAALRVARLRLGEEILELVDWTRAPSRPVPADSRSNDRWFQHIAIIVRDMDKAYEYLAGRGVQHVSPGPQTLPDWNPNAGGIRAFYFQDPERHVLEVLWFPPGKGEARWHAPGDDLFLGIDHTAIVVEDTETSLAFYRDTLGMRVAGGSVNYGPEQERLNSVFAARLRITTLRAVHGPGVELLEYVAPPGGRPYPDDVRAPDLLFWQTVLVAPESALEAAAHNQRQVPPVVVTGDAALGFTQSALLRDPDGHVLHLVTSFAVAAPMEEMHNAHR